MVGSHAVAMALGSTRHGYHGKDGCGVQEEEEVDKAGFQFRL
jgi:hypothetical protein